MFSAHRFLYKPVVPTERNCATDAHVQDLEKNKAGSDLVLSFPPTPHTKRDKPKLIVVVIILTLLFAIYYGPTLVDRSVLDFKYCTHESRPIEWAQPPDGAVKLNVTNLEPECNNNPKDANCKLLMDGSRKTAWQSPSVAPAGGHTVLIDLLQNYHVASITVAPKRSADKPLGFPYKHVVKVGTAKNDLITVATGTWRAEGDEVRSAVFEPRLARYVQLIVFETTQAQNFVIINELEIYHIPDGSTRPLMPKDKGGKWDVTLNFPIVPVSAFFNPINGELVTLSSFAPDTFHSDEPIIEERFTRSATWNPRTGIVGERKVDETQHDMFCPGTSFDKDGQVFVTGGTTPKQFSVFDPRVNPNGNPAGSWSAIREKLKLGRGYAGQTYVADGTTFTIGGTWGPAREEDKDGEVYDGKGEWKLLKGAKGSSIKMNESWACLNPEDKDWVGDRTQCVKKEWQQHHPWLFAWKGNSIFHAGPSKAMHWFRAADNGTTKDAGLRADDNDAVCAITSMYDAEKGLILTAGGAPNYHYWVGDPRARVGPVRKEATSHAFEIELQDPDKPVATRKLPPMKHPRIFANAVTLPTGETLVVGGQRQGEPFFEETWQAIPEIYSPAQPSAINPWREVARHITPRVYHSWALLTTNATVIVGGGGLNRPETNHYDAQIYEPPYLFTSNGERRKQPVITKLNKKLFKLGDTAATRTIQVTVDDSIEGASLLRYSAVTHTLNNDMRRIKLVQRPVSIEEKTYTFEIPNDPGVALPGYWMLFVLANGVPSKAETIQILAKA